MLSVKLCIPYLNVSPSLKALRCGGPRISTVSHTVLPLHTQYIG